MDVMSRALERPMHLQQVCRPPVSGHSVLRLASQTIRPGLATRATAATARVKEQPDQIVQPTQNPRPLVNGLNSSSEFADALPSFGE